MQISLPAHRRRSLLSLGAASLNLIEKISLHRRELLAWGRPETWIYSTTSTSQVSGDKKKKTTNKKEKYHYLLMLQVIGQCSAQQQTCIFTRTYTASNQYVITTKRNLRERTSVPARRTRSLQITQRSSQTGGGVTCRTGLILELWGRWDRCIRE